MQKLELGGAQRRFDADTTNHCHIRCIRCKRVDDVGCEPHAHVEIGQAAVRGYKILGHRLELIGVCPECQEHRMAERR